MKKKTRRKKVDAAFEPTSKARVIPRNRRTTMSPESRKPHNIKVRTNIHLDLDVINFFKKRAKEPGGLPYQTQINAALRKAMAEELSGVDPDWSRLIENEKFISAVAEKVRSA